MIRRNSNIETTFQLVPRYGFHWVDVVILVASISSTSTQDLLCGGNTIANWLYALSCLTGLRLLTRIEQFKKHFIVVIKSLSITSMNLLYVACLLAILSVFAFSMFRGVVKECKNQIYKYYLTQEVCSL
jgi:hypothetical protein